MRKFIHITKEDREFIMSAFSVTGRTVFNAMNYTDCGRSESFEKMRRLALLRGGQEMVEALEMETFHDADKYMRQYLPGGILIEMSKNDGSCDVFRKGERVAHYDDVRVKDIDGIQERAMTMG